jgi:hypothetical protein
MSTRADLLAAVLTEPTRDNCAVYGDFLLGAGDPRGELISLDLAREDELARERRYELRMQRHRLVQIHGRTWWPWLPPSKHPLKMTTRHGFCTSVVAQMEWANPVFDCFAGEPVLALTLGGSSPPSGGLCAASFWSRLRHLEIHHHFDEKRLTTFLQRTALDRLQTLKAVWSAQHGDAFAEGLPGLDELELRVQGDERACVEALLGWRRLGGLRRLDLRLASLGADHLQLLVSVGNFTALEQLTLSAPISDAGVAHLASHAERFPALTSLRISAGFGGIGQDSVTALAGATFPRLAHLCLWSGDHFDLSPLAARYKTDWNP